MCAEGLALGQEIQTDCSINTVQDCAGMPTFSFKA
jgi:hypothetical protein